MNDLKTLQIHIEHLFDELPEELSCSIKSINPSTIMQPHSLFDPDTQLPETTTLEHFIPIIVLPDDNGNYSIIDGYKRYLSYRNSNCKAVTCTCIQTRLSEFAAGLLRIALNSGRPRPLQEKCRILQWLQNRCTEDTFESTARKAGFSPKEIEQILPFLQSDSPIQEAVFSGAIDISLTRYFKILSNDDQRSFLDTFKDLKLSVQTQREFLEWLPEIAYTRDTTVGTVLAEPHIRETLRDTTRNAPQKINRIRTYIYTQKFPRLSEARSVWETHAKTCNPDPSCVTFSPQPYFEKNKLEVSVTITDAQKGVEIFSALAAIPQKNWQKLIYPCDYISKTEG